MAAFNRLQLGIEETGGTVTVPNDPRARLMYYVDCICSVIDVDDGGLRRLRNYRNYWLSGEDVDKLLVIAAMLEPNVLLNKVIFQNDAMCKDSGNAFYKIHAVNHTIAVANSLVIGGVRRNTTEIMFFKMNWLTRNYFEPLKQVLLQRRQQQAAAAQRAQSCAIL